MDLGQQQQQQQYPSQEHQTQQQGSLRTTTAITDLAVVVDVVDRNLAADVDDVGWVLAVVVDVK